MFSDMHEEQERQLVEDTKKEISTEILQGFMHWINGAISYHHNKAVRGDREAGAKNQAFYEVKCLIKTAAEKYNVEVK